MPTNIQKLNNMTIRELHTIEKNSWNDMTIHPLQSFEWGVIREETGLKVVRFGCFEDENLKEVYQMTIHKIPLINYSIGYIPRSKIPSEDFLSYLREYSKKYNIVSVMFEPDAVASTQHIPTQLSVSKNPLFYKWTRIIDTSKSLESLKQELDSGTRYNIGLAERKGVIVKEETGEEAFNDFYKIYDETTKRQNFGGHAKNYHKKIWDIFGKEKISHILVARFSGRPLAACQLWLYKNTLYYTYAGSSNEDRNLKAMNALMWAVVCFAKEHGATKLDLWGIVPPNDLGIKSNWIGFSDFKKGYGGEVVEMIGSYDLVVFPLMYQIYNIAYKLRKLFI